MSDEAQRRVERATLAWRKSAWRPHGISPALDRNLVARRSMRSLTVVRSRNVKSKERAAGAQSLDGRLIASTSIDAFGETSNRRYGSRDIQIVIQGCTDFCDVWSRICSRLASYGRAQLA